jgi:hypothetical protein
MTAKGLLLPDYMHVSTNYYRRSFRRKCSRRLKNVIVTLDWIPDTTQVCYYEVFQSMFQFIFQSVFSVKVSLN